ncbi:uncharacterized protein si:ch211-57n23.1 isoform X1 [Syngnathus acus]|uniref:uncharacterized protein si:ch211-57n23.1 isoform X1 n=2 Tax=Syngnathus acus TaxID=161584 RepID=UPI00188613AD|nr:uncharacterized protein si:ch211-57n23.1 isoform X1 [Syngnathus acus]
MGQHSFFPMTSGSRSGRARQDYFARLSLAHTVFGRFTCKQGRTFRFDNKSLEMFCGLMWSWTWLLLGFCACASREDVSVDEDNWTNDEWGSGFSPVYRFLADSPPEAAAVGQSPLGSMNCTQRFWLPSSTPGICWENVARPEELARSRLLALQNRAALEGVMISCRVEEGGLSYQRQARDEVEGVLSDHRSVAEALDTMEKVFVSLEEKRKDGKDGGLLTSVKEHLAQARESAFARQLLASSLERHLSSLEENLMHMQLRLHKLIRQ